MTTEAAISIGSRWRLIRGQHAGSVVQIVAAGASVKYRNLGGGKSVGSDPHDDEGRTHSRNREEFLTLFEPATSGGNGQTHAAFRQRNAPKRREQSELSPPLSFNGIDLGAASPLNVEILEITPALAQAWLDRGGNNRPPTKSRVRRLTNAIRRGEWRLTGDSIKLDGEGHVRDGRHRLLAIIDASLPIRTLVVRGVGEEDFTVFDTGKSRTPGDVMSIAGYKNSVGIASNARALILIEASGRLDPPNRAELEPLYSHTALLRYVREHPDVEEGVLLANQVRAQGMSGGAGLLGTLFTLLLRADARAAGRFADLLASGANLERDSPILRFRNRLITDKRMPNGVADREHLLAIGIKAWNFWRAGELVGQLTWHAQRSPGSRSGEAFPVAQ